MDKNRKKLFREKRRKTKRRYFKNKRYNKYTLKRKKRGGTRIKNLDEEFDKLYNDNLQSLMRNDKTIQENNQPITDKLIKEYEQQLKRTLKVKDDAIFKSYIYKCSQDNCCSINNWKQYIKNRKYECPHIALFKNWDYVAPDNKKP
jgi:hypothetical protein